MMMNDMIMINMMNRMEVLVNDEWYDENNNDGDNDDNDNDDNDNDDNDDDNDDNDNDNNHFQKDLIIPKHVHL